VTAMRLPPAATMLLLSGSGMAVGLAIDCGATPPALIAGLCTAAPASLAATFRFHMTMMPAGYALTAVGSLLAVGLTTGTHRDAAAMAARLSCVALMLAGMIGGGWLAPHLAMRLGVTPGFGLLVAAMAAGMTLAAIAGAAVTHLAGMRDRARRAAASQYIMYQ